MTEAIEYNSPIGILKLTCTEDAVKSVLFAGDDQDVNTFSSEQNNFEPLLPITKQVIEELNNYFAGSSFHFSVKLKQQGTAFQQSVWDALTSIKPGITQSYLQLSKSLGNVKAIRAVGTANGRNSIAIIVPCHRVIGSNGSLVGYAGGLWRKKWLLEHEAKHLSGLQTLF
ncbi:MAG: methylated-DNA--[protein]-cysteine S-methyltransferase [Ferruginibacter sp.]